jgi:hypothetical protein
MILNSEQNIVEKLFLKQKSQIKFLEQYYSEKFGKQLTVDLQVTNTSSINLHAGKITISVLNLIEMLRKENRLFYSLFYTLLMHEIGHALYTPITCNYSNISNILEDARLEHQLSKTNMKVRFDIMRYIFHDSRMSLKICLSSKDAFLMSLIRTIENEKFVNIFSLYKEQDEIVKKIMEKSKEYIELDYDAKCSPSQVIDLDSRIFDISILLDQLFKNMPKNPSQQAQKGDGKGKLEEQDETEEQEQDETQSGEEKEQSKNSEEKEQSKNSKEKEKSKNDEEKAKREKQEKEEKLQEMKDEIKKLLDENMEIKKELGNQPYLIKNKYYNETIHKYDYETFPIQLFDVLRRNSIRGKSDEYYRKSGKQQELNIKKYGSRDFSKVDKYFDKNMQGQEKSSETLSFVFYLDISQSMTTTMLVDGKQRTSIDLATTYLKNFYDQMSKNFEIKLFAFDTEIYELGRPELNLNFIRQHCQGYTEPKLLPIKKSEQVFIITDGMIQKIPQEYLEKAHFIILTDGRLMHSFDKVNHKVFVNSNNFKEGMEQATLSIKKKLGGF